MPSIRAAVPSRLFVVWLSVLALTVTALPAMAQSPEETRIAETRADLQAVRDELDGARSKAEDDKIALEDADLQLRTAFDAVQAASQAVGRQQSSVDDAEQRLNKAQDELSAQRTQMAERVGDMYRQARPDTIIAVLGASTVTEAVQQSTYMNAIGRKDRGQVETLNNAQAVVQAEERALQDEQAAMGRVLEEQEALLAQVEEIRQDKALVAAASDDLVARLQAREEHLESEAAELARIAREQAAQAAAAAVIAQQQADAAAAAAASQTTVLASAGSPAGGSAGDTSDPGTTSGQAAPAEQAVAAPDAAQRPAGEESAAIAAEAPDAAGAPAAPVAEAEAPAEAPEPEPVAAPAPSGGGFSWPTQGSVTSEFGQRWGRMHEGIDIANGQGTAIGAAKGGTVIQAGPYSGYGNLVLVAHSDGFVTAYAHMASIAVTNGQSVSTGTLLGGMGCSGSCTGTHLHFEIRANGTPVDPRGYL